MSVSPHGLKRREIELTAWTTFQKPDENEDAYLGRLKLILQKTLQRAYKSETSIVKKLYDYSHVQKREGKDEPLFASFNKNLREILEARPPFEQRLDELTHHLSLLRWQEKLQFILRNDSLKEHSLITNFVNLILANPHYSFTDFKTFIENKKLSLDISEDLFDMAKRFVRKSILKFQPWAQNHLSNPNHLIDTKRSIFQMLSRLSDDFDSWIFDEMHANEEKTKLSLKDWKEIKELIDQTHEELAQTCPPFIFTHFPNPTGERVFKQMQESDVILKHLMKKATLIANKKEPEIFTADDITLTLQLATIFIYRYQQSQNISALENFLHDAKNYSPLTSEVTFVDEDGSIKTETHQTSSPVQHALQEIERFFHARKEFYEFKLGGYLTFPHYSSRLECRVAKIIAQWNIFISNELSSNNTLKQLQTTLTELTALNECTKKAQNFDWKAKMKGHGYRFSKSLGQGNLGHVQLWKRTYLQWDSSEKKITEVKEKYAVKELKTLAYCPQKENFLKYYQTWLQGFQGERTARIQDRHFVQVLGSFSNKNGAEAYVMQYVKATQNLFQFIESSNATRGISLSDFKTIVIDLLEAVKILHEARLVQGDLKLEDILLSATKEVVLVDTSFQTLLPMIAEFFHDENITPHYSAPECYFRNEGTGNKMIPQVSLPIDIYSLGIIIFAFYAGEFPFINTSEQLLHPPKDQTAVDNYKWDLIKNIDLQKLLKAMLSYDPSQRPPIHQVLDHFNAIDWPQEQNGQDTK